MSFNVSGMKVPQQNMSVKPNGTLLFIQVTLKALKTLIKSSYFTTCLISDVNTYQQVGGGGFKCRWPWAVPGLDCVYTVAGFNEEAATCVHAKYASISLYMTKSESETLLPCGSD